MAGCDARPGRLGQCFFGGLLIRSTDVHLADRDVRIVSAPMGVKATRRLGNENARQPGSLARSNFSG
jgi:hypothetical protein